MAAAEEVDLAAHVDHTIEHSWADFGATIGLALGLLAGAAIIYVGRSKKAVELAANVVTRVQGWGATIGSWFKKKDSGHIIEGSHDTFYGPQLKPAARMFDRTACASPGGAILDAIPILGDLRRGWRGLRNAWNHYVNGIEVLPSDYAPGAHPQSKIADGSMTVSVNDRPAARLGDGVDPCAGKISEGIRSITIGGPRGSAAGTADRNEVDGTVRGITHVIDGVANFMGGPHDAAVWLAENYGGYLDERIPALAKYYNYSVGWAKAFSRDPSDVPLTGLDRIQRANEYIGRAQNTPEQGENLRRIISPPAPPQPVFDRARGRWVAPPPPRRLF